MLSGKNICIFRLIVININDVNFVLKGSLSICIFVILIKYR